MIMSVTPATDPAGATDPAVLDVRDVRVALGGSVVVEEATFALRPGDLVVLTGVNGAGKSTLLRAVVHLLPYDGQVRILGMRPDHVAARARFMFVPDEAALYEDLTLDEHVRFTTLLYGRPDDEPAIRDWLTSFRLGGRTGEFPHTHSRGMRQKTALALALGLSTPLTIFDEPYNALDEEAQESLSEGLILKARAGGAVLLTGHQPGLARALGAQELLLQDGRLVESAEARA